jgi:hypothetical protein
MNRFMKTAVGITLLLAFAMLLTGCVSIEMKVKKNGSCDLKYEIRTEGMVRLSDVKKQLQNSIDEANENAGRNVAKLKDVKEKDGTVTAKISISNVSFIDDGAFFGKYSEFSKEYPEKLETLVDAKSGMPIERDGIKGTGGLNVIMLSGMETGGGDLLDFKLILPGTVKYMSSNVSVIDDKTVSLSSGYGVVLYKRGGGAGWLLYVLIIAAAAVVVLVLLGKKKKGSSTADFAAAPAEAPVQTPAAAPVAAHVQTSTAAQAYAGNSAAPTSAATATAPASDTNAVVNCPYCNSVQRSSAIFCSACGKKISQ